MPKAPTGGTGLGCLAMLGGPLFIGGIWLVAVALLQRPDTPWAQPAMAAGAALAVAGLLAALSGIRRRRDAAPQDPPGTGVAAPELFDSADPEQAEAAVVAPATAGRPGAPVAGVGPGLGCGLVCLAFLLVGPFFLYLYFSGVPTKRGNPIMPLIVGVLFTLVGLLGTYALLTSRKDG